MRIPTYSLESIPSENTPIISCIVSDIYVAEEQKNKYKGHNKLSHENSFLDQIPEEEGNLYKIYRCK